MDLLIIAFLGSAVSGWVRLTPMKKRLLREGVVFAVSAACGLLAYLWVSYPSVRLDWPMIVFSVIFFYVMGWFVAVSARRSGL